MTDAVAGGYHRMTQKLIEAGIIPPQCARWEIVSDVKDAVKLRYEVFVTEAQYVAICQALIDNKNDVGKTDSFGFSKEYTYPEQELDAEDEGHRDI